MTMTHDDAQTGAGLSDHDAAVAAVQDRLSLHWHMDIPEHGVRMMLELMDIPGPEHVTPGLINGARRLRAYHAGLLAESELFVATPELCRVLKAAAPHYPDARLHISDMLAPYGMAWFADPIDDPAPYDTREQVPIRMLSWSITEPGGSLLADLGRPHDQPVLTIIGYSDIGRIPRKRGLGRGDAPSVYPIVSVMWEVGSANGGTLYNPVDAMTAAVLREPYVKLLLAYWAVMRQRLTETSAPTARILPGLVKRAKKRTPKLNTAVHIVRMRPRHRGEAATSGEKRSVDWRNQWIVRPHWRDQWYPSTEEHKPILIMPYLKGPEDKPVIGAERAFLPPKPKP